jgi:CO/xanthine dehydrogenase FAD-binding subunit
MRAYLPAYDLVAPATLSEALSLLAATPGALRPFAGGTDLMVLLEAGKLPESRYLGLWRLKELRGISETEGALSLGALTTYTDVLRSATLQREFPLMCRAAAETGGIATQNHGTIGGNIANASPAADTPPALLVYDAEIEVASVRGTRRIPYARFHQGYKKMDLAPDEIITRIHLPRHPTPPLAYYRKVGTRRAQAISKVCLAMVATLDSATNRLRHVRIAVNSVAPAVIRCTRAEHALEEHALDAAARHAAMTALAADIAPIDDIRSTATYRMRVAQQLLAEAMERIPS